MEPVAPSQTTRATLVDLLDRLLEKGLVIRADLVVSLAGVPLIGVSLNAAVAGIETMLEYGLMADWDAGTRAVQQGQQPSPPNASSLFQSLATACGPASNFLTAGEEITHAGEMWFKVEGDHPSQSQVHGRLLEGSDGTPGTAWQQGTLYLTSGRMCWIRDFDWQMFFEVPLDRIASCALEPGKFSKMLRGKHVVDVVYQPNGSKKVVSFAGRQALDWEKVINCLLCEEEVAHRMRSGREPTRAEANIIPV